MAKIDENRERTIYKRKDGLVVRKKQPRKSASKQWDEQLTRKAKKFDREVL